MNSWISLGTPRVSYQTYRQWHSFGSQTWESSLPLTSGSVLPKPVRGFVAEYFVTNSMGFWFTYNLALEPHWSAVCSLKELSESSSPLSPRRTATSSSTAATGDAGWKGVEPTATHVFLRNGSNLATDGLQVFGALDCVDNIRFTTTQVKKCRTTGLVSYVRIHTNALIQLHMEDKEQH